MRRLLLLPILLLAFGFSRLVPLAQAADDGVITGRIVNGTAGAAVPTGVQVNLAGVTPSGAATDQFTTRTVTAGDDGTFRFDGLPKSSQFSYLVTADYLGVTYLGETTVAGQTDPVQLLPLTDTQPAMDISLKVFETTADDPGLKANLEHLIIQPSAPVVWVLDVVNLTNPADRAYVGKAGPAGQPAAALHFTLPAGATSINPMTGLDPSRMAATADGFDSQAAVLPGDSSVSFLYAVPYSGDSLSMERVFNLPTDKVTVLLEDVGAKIDSPQFPTWDSTEQNGQPFLMSSMSGGQAGGRMTLDFSGLPQASAATGSSGGGSDYTIPIVAGAGVLGALALLGLYLRLRGQLLGQPPEPVLQSGGAGAAPPPEPASVAEGAARPDGSERPEGGEEGG